MENNTLKRKKLGWIERAILQKLKTEGFYDGKQMCFADELKTKVQIVNEAFKRLERTGFITMKKMPHSNIKKVTLRGGGND